MRYPTNRTFWLLLSALLGGLGGILCPQPAQGGPFTAYQIYQRSTGSPTPVVSSFSLRDPSAPYTLNIYNGGRADIQTGARVSSAVIILNGAVIASPQFGLEL